MSKVCSWSCFEEIIRNTKQTLQSLLFEISKSHFFEVPAASVLVILFVSSTLKQALLPERESPVLHLVIQCLSAHAYDHCPRTSWTTKLCSQ